MFYTKEILIASIYKKGEKVDRNRLYRMLLLELDELLDERQLPTRRIQDSGLPTEIKKDRRVNSRRADDQQKTDEKLEALCILNSNKTIKSALH